MFKPRKGVLIDKFIDANNRHTFYHLVWRYEDGNYYDEFNSPLSRYYLYKLGDTGMVTERANGF